MKKDEKRAVGIIFIVGLILILALEYSNYTTEKRLEHEREKIEKTVPKDFYKKDLTLNVLGPVGDVVSEWIIKGAFIKTMSQGDFDWSAPDTVELSMTIAMDYCVLNY